MASGPVDRGHRNADAVMLAEPDRRRTMRDMLLALGLLGITVLLGLDVVRRGVAEDRADYENEPSNLNDVGWWRVAEFNDAIPRRVRRELAAQLRLAEQTARAELASELRESVEKAVTSGVYAVSAAPMPHGVLLHLSDDRQLLLATMAAESGTTLLTRVADGPLLLSGVHIGPVDHRVEFTDLDGAACHVHAHTVTVLPA